MKPLSIAVLHCSACSGKNRRRDVGRLTRNYLGEFNFRGFGPLKDEAGFRAGVRTDPTCELHGVLDIGAAQDVGEELIAAHARTGRVQHLAIPPTIPEHSGD